MQEDRVSTTAYFITLTYDTENVPISNNGFLTLDKRDVQLFIKRLRKVHEGKGTDKKKKRTQKSLKYFLAGEYGTKGGRPHYHIILFNCQLKLMLSTSDLKILNFTGYDGANEIQIKQWEKGYATIGMVSEASVGYTLKYILKQKTRKKHNRDDRTTEFQLMSKGLGKNYVNNKNMAWHKADLLNRMYLNIEDGKKIAMPRYYKDKLYTQFERSEISGYQKGEIEKKQYDYLKQMQVNPQFVKQVMAAKKASMKRVAFNAVKAQKL